MKKRRFLYVWPFFALLSWPSSFSIIFLLLSGLAVKKWRVEEVRQDEESFFSCGGENCYFHFVMMAAKSGNKGRENIYLANI